MDDKRSTTKIEQLNSLQDNRATTPYAMEKEETTNRSKVDYGDIIGNGYVIGILLSEDSGEADLHFCKKEEKVFVAKIYKQSYKQDTGLAEKLKKIDSPYVMKIIDSGSCRNRYFEIIPYYKNGTLLDRLTETTDEFIKNVVVFELNEGLKAIHNQDISHDDIKPHNIFINDDLEHICIGDFGISKNLMGRAYRTKKQKEMTVMYSAPEAAELSSKISDYYSFGMTLLHLAFHDDPFKGIADRKIRTYNLMYTPKIPKEIDPELGDLIAKLIEYNPQVRINYDGVKKWLSNKNEYHNARLSHNDFIEQSGNRIIAEYTFNVNGKEEVFKDLKSLAVAMSSNWEFALKHFQNNLITEAVKKYNQSLYLKLLDIYKKYQNEPDKGLYFTLQEINPDLGLAYQGKIYSSFVDYIKNLIKGYPSSPEKYDIEILLHMVKYDQYDSKIPYLIQEIYDAYHPKKRFEDMLINYFVENPKIFSNGKIYDSLADYLSSFFLSYKINPCQLELENPLFYGLLVKLYKLDQEKLNEISKIKNDIERFATLTKFVVGYLPFSNKSFKAYNLSMLVDIVIKSVEQDFKAAKDYFKNLSNNNCIELLLMVEENIPKSFIKRYKNTKKIETKEHLIYYLLNPNATYLGKKDLKSLSEKLAKMKAFDYKVGATFKDPSFLLWLEGKGYKIT